MAAGILHFRKATTDAHATILLSLVGTFALTIKVTPIIPFMWDRDGALSK
jgi:hypothetical protein